MKLEEMPPDLQALVLGEVSKRVHRWANELQRREYVKAAEQCAAVAEWIGDAAERARHA